MKDRLKNDADTRVREEAVVRLGRSDLENVLPSLVERGHGGVINVSSMAGELPLAYSATYGATKAFVTSFSLALAEELRGSGVRVQALLPGYTRTAFAERAGMDESKIPSAAWLSADTVADESFRALQRDQPLCIPGTAYRALAGAQRLVPRGLLRRVAAAATGRFLG